MCSCRGSSAQATCTSSSHEETREGPVCVRCCSQVKLSVTRAAVISLLNAPITQPRESLPHKCKNIRPVYPKGAGDVCISIRPVRNSSKLRRGGKKKRKVICPLEQSWSEWITCKRKHTYTRARAHMHAQGAAVFHFFAVWRIRCM